MSTTITTAYHMKKFPTEVIYPIVSDLPGLVLLVVLAVHSAVDHQITCLYFLSVLFLCFIYAGKPLFPLLSTNIYS